MDRRFTVEVLESAAREYERLPRREKRRVAEAIDALENDPSPADSIKLQNFPGFRIRAGRFRVLYQVGRVGRRITVVRIGPRKDVYRRLAALLPR